MNEGASSKTGTAGNGPLRILIGVSAAVFLLCVIYLASVHLDVRGHANRSLASTLPAAENPIDFDALQQDNPDIYAWLYVPGTNVNHPVAQHPSNDFYYLSHNENHEESFIGCPYTELANSKAFDDPVTVIYGHNIKNGIMFNTLHRFEDVSFFDRHRVFFVYTPEYVYTYGIVAAAGYEDFHILNTQDLSDESVVSGYFEGVTKPRAIQKNTRDAVALDTANRIVQLSTCNYTNGLGRYVVTGMLVCVQRAAPASP